MQSPEENEKKINRISAAWRQNAPTASFAGMTLPEFNAAVAPSLAARAALGELEAQAKVLADQRDDADLVSMPTVARVVKGIAGDVNYGTDSALYEACGYVRDSERKTGLTRKKKPSPPGTP